ncbi:cell adhesion molecule CEACAM3-like [Pituophis catenifer annectens]|uniref:cell adhesion molecule CEACAM3-like n=1 Tax=Pituophis catenifer annectens TaxID=94852 RepID=UPI00399570E3
MEPFRSHPGSQTALFLAGCILSCLLQLVSAQENLTVVSVPEKPIEGQSVLLHAKNIRQGFVRCEWTQPSGENIVLVSDAKFTPPDASQVVVLHQNCSLTIKNLRSTDRGRYTVKVTLPPAKQQEPTGPEIYIGSIFLTFCDEKQIRIRVEPPNPLVGQNVKMTPGGMPAKNDLCYWKQKTKSGVQKDIHDSGEEPPNKEQNQQQKIKQYGCSLHLNQLTEADSGNYSIYVEVSTDQNSGREGKGTREQIMCYRSQTQLIVTRSGSASLKYSAGIIAGALLGSLTWTSSLSLLPLFFGVLSPFFPEC